MKYMISMICCINVSMKQATKYIYKVKFYPKMTYVREYRYNAAWIAESYQTITKQVCKTIVHFYMLTAYGTYVGCSNTLKQVLLDMILRKSIY